MQYAIENEIRPEELLGDNTSLYQSLWENRTLEEARDWLCSRIAIVMDYSNANREGAGEYIKRITAYVRENYDRDITIDSVAEHIGISYSYLRRLYKEATGQNLVDYINELRLQKAKRLLRQTDYTVREVADLCGFHHERSFSRAFAHAEGLPPGKYKTLYRKVGE